MRRSILLRTLPAFLNDPYRLDKRQSSSLFGNGRVDAADPVCQIQQSKHRRRVSHDSRQVVERFLRPFVQPILRSLDSLQPSPHLALPIS